MNTSPNATTWPAVWTVLSLSGIFSLNHASKLTKGKPKRFVDKNGFTSRRTIFLPPIFSLLSPIFLRLYEYPYSFSRTATEDRSW